MQQLIWFTAPIFSAHEHQSAFSQATEKHRSRVFLTSHESGCHGTVVICCSL